MTQLLCPSLKFFGSGLSPIEGLDAILSYTEIEEAAGIYND